MKEYKLLYQIKTLEKLIGRKFICCDKFKNFVPPTPTQMQIVEYILEHPKEKIYQKDLEEILNLRRATVSGVLQTMEKNKMIERVVDENDFRIKRIVLNPIAKKIFKTHEKKMTEIEKNIIKGISEEELAQFLKVIHKMQDNLKLVAEKERN